MVHHSATNFSQSAIVLPKRSLIDNTLARACMLKRARDEVGTPATLKKPRSDGGVADEAEPPRAEITPRNAESAIKPPEIALGDAGSAIKLILPDLSSFGSGSSVSSGWSLCSSLSSCSGCDDTEALSHDEAEDMCPYAYIESVLVGAGEHKSGPVRLMEPLRESDFLPRTEEQIAAYSSEVIAALRDSNLTALRGMHSRGHAMRCSNRFGESLLHMACRRASPAVVRFLLDEADVSPRIRDDYGRTPLHDACWRGRPEPEIVELLLEKESKLAFVRDVRGHRPFQYARREHWGVWREFLGRRRDLILC